MYELQRKKKKLLCLCSFFSSFFSPFFSPYRPDLPPPTLLPQHGSLSVVDTEGSISHFKAQRKLLSSFLGHLPISPLALHGEHGCSDTRRGGACEDPRKEEPREWTAPSYITRVRPHTHKNTQCMTHTCVRVCLSLHGALWFFTRFFTTSLLLFLPRQREPRTRFPHSG